LLKIDREILDDWAEKAILVIYCAALIFGILATGAVRSLEFLVLQGAAIILGLLWMARLWLKPKPHLLFGSIYIPILSFVAYAVVRCHFVQVQEAGRTELIRVLVYALFFFVAVNNLNRQDSTQFISGVLLLLALGLALMAIYQYVTHPLKIWHFKRPALYLFRGSGTFINPNHLAGFMEMVLPLALSFTLIGRFSPATKVVLAYSAVVMVAGIGVTISRGGWIATGVGLFAFFAVMFFHRGLWLRSVIMLAVVSIAIGAFVANNRASHERFSKTLVNGTNDTRVVLAGAAVKMWQENVVWGVGPGHYDYRFRQFRPEGLQLRPQYAHNDYLNLLADWGAVGFALAVAVFAALYINLFRTWRFVKPGQDDMGTRKSNKAALVLGAGLGLFSLLIHEAVEFNLQIPALALVAATLMAVLTGYSRFATSEIWVTIRLPLKLLVTGGLAVAVGFLSWQEFDRAREYISLERAHSAGSLQEQVAAWKRAAEINPRNSETTYALGEAYRVQGWEGDVGYEALIAEALAWFEKGISLNRYDPYNYMRYGMCLDWLGKHGEADPYFQKALQLDPNGYFVLAHLGWHSFQAKDYAKAKFWLERSLRIVSAGENPIAATYLEYTNAKLAEGAR
jgi:O-antigen ligase